MAVPAQYCLQDISVLLLKMNIAAGVGTVLLAWIWVLWVNQIRFSYCVSLYGAVLTTDWSCFVYLKERGGTNLQKYFPARELDKSIPADSLYSLKLINLILLNVRMCLYYSLKNLRRFQVNAVSDYLPERNTRKLIGVFLCLLETDPSDCPPLFHSSQSASDLLLQVYGMTCISEIT